MQAREIPQNSWADFFDTFSTQHEDWITTIQVGDKVEASELPLIGVSADRDGSVEIEVGRDSSDRMTHIIDDAERVRFGQSEDEAQLEMEIEAADGQKTVVRFRRAAREERRPQIRKGRTRQAGG